MTAIGERIKLVRIGTGLNQAQFSRIVGVSRSFLSQVEAGKSKPAIEIFVGISTHYPDVDLHWLLSGPTVAGEPRQAIPAARRIEQVDQLMLRTGLTIDQIVSAFDATKSGAPPVAPISPTAMEKIVTAAAEALEETGLRMRPDKFAQLCTALYEMEQDSGASVSKAVVLRLVKSAA